MTLNYYSQSENHTRSTSGIKDSPFKMAVVGYGVPICILIVVIVNFWVGRVYVPASNHGAIHDGLIRSYPYGWLFAGIVTVKVGFAGALFSWYVLANYVRTEGLAIPSLIGSLVVCGIGLVLYAVGFFI